MAIGPDRVQVLKVESAPLGGDAADDIEPYGQDAPIEPQEDALECAGVYMQDASARDEQVYVGRSSDDMCFRDVNNSTPLTLSQLYTDLDKLILSPSNGMVLVQRSTGCILTAR